MYELGKAIMPVMCLVPTAIFAFLAWRERSTTGPTVPLYTTAAILAPSYISYTLLVMNKVNEALMQKARSATSSTDCNAVADATGDENTHALVYQWGLHNLVRATMTGFAGILALWASLESEKL